MGAFAAISTAKPNMGGNYIPKGDHLLKVAEIKRVDSTHKGTVSLVCEFDVIESTDPDLKPGAKVASVFGMHQAACVSNLKHLLAILNDVDFEAVDEAMVEKSMGKDQPLTGTAVFCMAFPHITVKNKKEIIKTQWYAVK